MPTPEELKEKFYKAVKSDRTMMLGLNRVDEAHTRPMTGLLDGDDGPIWFFSSTEAKLVQETGQGSAAVATFADKGHNVFACVHGTLSIETNRAMVDKLWNPFVAAWYEQGKDDPKLALLRLDPEDAEIWENGSSLVAAFKLLFGSDPKADYRDQVAKVDLSE